MSIIVTNMDIASTYFKSIMDEADRTVKTNPKLYSDFQKRFDVECIEKRKTKSEEPEDIFKLLVTEKTTKKTDWLNYLPQSEEFELYSGLFLSNQQSFLETDIFCRLAIKLFKTK
jgi:hypothetical protein